MPSYTALARTQTPATLPPPEVLRDPVLAEQWFLSLPPQAQDNLKANLTAIVQSLPPALQLDLRRKVAAQGHSNPIPSAVDGLGFWHRVSVNSTKSVRAERGGRYGRDQVAGLGQWGAVVGALIQTGGSLWSADRQASLTRDLSRDALATDVKLQQAALAAQRETELALIAAQTQAAQIAGGASVARAQINAPVLAASLKWGGIALGVAAFAIGGIILLRKKK